MGYKLVTTPIDEQDPRYIDYLKTTDTPSWIGYQNYCGDLYQKELNESLLKYAKRNEDFLNEINHAETFLWLQKHIKSEPPRQTRDEMGTALFEAMMRIGGSYNSLMMELGRDELEKEYTKSYLDRILVHKETIDTYNNRLESIKDSQK